MENVQEEDSAGSGRPRRSCRNQVMPTSNMKRPLTVVASTRRKSSEPLSLKNGSLSKRRKNNEQADLTILKLEQVEQLSQGMSSLMERPVGTGNGVIKSLSLYNFMCHESFHQEWHENINFIVGENGSGKSALLSGLLVGLGAKALTTSRTNSIKELIKTGKNFAKIEVTLLNGGALSLETYGRQLTIQRILDIKGTTTYKIQSNGGKFRPLRKPELDKILVDLNIQLNNPVVILNQEYARSFLCSKKPSDKYKLFQDGIGAHQCEAILEDIDDDVEKITDNLQKKKEEVDRAIVKYDEMKDKVKIIDGASAYKEKFKSLTLELAWRHVADEETASTKCKEEMDKSTRDFVKTQEAYNTSLEDKKKLSEEAAPSGEVQQERKIEKERLEGLRNSIRDSTNVLRRELNSAKLKVSSNTNFIKLKQNMVTKLEERITRDDEKAKEDYERMKQQVIEERKTLKSEISTVEQEIGSLSQDKDNFLRGADAIKEELESMRGHRRELETVMNRKKAQLTQLESSEDTVNYDVFGPRMVRLVDKINSMKQKFKKEPKGPLGACFKVREQKYAKIIQYYLRSKLCDFIVDNTKDAQLLNGIITSIYGTQYVKGSPRPNVLLTKYCPAHNFSSTNASNGLKFPSIIDMLDVDNNDHIVTNALLDFCQVERYLLFKDTKEALSILENQITTPKSCKGGFTLDFYKVTPDPNLRVDALKEKKNETQLIRTSTIMQIKALTAEIRSLKEDLKKYVMNEEKVAEEKQLRAEYGKRDKAFRDKRNHLNALKMRLNSLKEPTNRFADQSSVKEELQELREELEKRQHEIIEQKALAETRDALIKEKDAEKATIDKDIERMSQEILSLYDYQEKQKEKSRTLDMFIQKLKTRMEKAKDKKDALEKAYTEAEAKVAESTSNASKRGERVETTRKIEAIINESNVIKAKLGEIEKTVGNRDDIYAAFEVAKKNYELIHGHWKAVDGIHKHLQKYVIRVKTYYFWSRDRLVNALKQCFESIVKSRGYKGGVIIDHDKRELYYFICPDEDSSEKMNLFEENLTSTKYKSKMMEYVAGLSGGERSFSTICFIISMWQAMKSPFYMLDEFDVFMDAMNRKTSQAALMSHAKLFPANQFFFFTPLDLSNMPHKDEALVLRMYPPKRDNATNGDENVVPQQPTASTSAGSSSRRRRGSETRSHSSAKTPRIK